MNEFRISYYPVNEASAREFLSWQYEPPYDIYNCLPEQMEAAIQYNIDPVNNVFAMLAEHGELVGYCSYGADARVQGGDYSRKALDIGLMLKPELTGQGMGAAYVKEVIRNGIQNYGSEKLRVTIAAFNKRAIRTWEKNGFQKTQIFKRSGDEMEFVVMTKTI